MQHFTLLILGINIITFQKSLAATKAPSPAAGHLFPFYLLFNIFRPFFTDQFILFQFLSALSRGTTSLSLLVELNHYPRTVSIPLPPATHHCASFAWDAAGGEISNPWQPRTDRGAGDLGHESLSCLIEGRSEQCQCGWCAEGLGRKLVGVLEDGGGREKHFWRRVRAGRELPRI